MTFTDSEWRLLAWLVKVAQQAVPANHPTSEHIPSILHRIDQTSGCAFERTPEHGDPGNLADTYRVGTREAAKLLGCTQRAVQQRITRGKLRADRIGRTWLLRLEDVQ